MIVRQDYLNRAMQPLSEQHYAIIQLLYEAIEGFEDLKTKDHMINRDYKECPLDKKTVQYIARVLYVRYSGVERDLRKKFRNIGGQVK